MNDTITISYCIKRFLSKFLTGFDGGFNTPAQVLPFTATGPNWLQWQWRNLIGPQWMCKTKKKCCAISRKCWLCALFRMSTTRTRLTSVKHTSSQVQFQVQPECRSASGERVKKKKKHPSSVSGCEDEMRQLCDCAENTAVLLSSLTRLHLKHCVCTRWLASRTAPPLKWHTSNPRPHRHHIQQRCHPPSQTLRAPPALIPKRLFDSVEETRHFESEACLSSLVEIGNLRITEEVASGVFKNWCMTTVHLCDLWLTACIWVIKENALLTPVH